MTKVEFWVCIVFYLKDDKGEPYSMRLGMSTDNYSLRAVVSMIDDKSILTT